MFTWATTLTGVLVGSGVVLIVAGLRGRQINDHPICRACGFDLIGTTHRADSPRGPSPLCPECGAMVDGRVPGSKPRPIILGQRRRRWRAVAVGGMLIAFGLAFGAVAVQPGAVGAWVRRNTPTVLVFMQGEMGSGEAAGELARRLRTGELDAGQSERASALALDWLEELIDTPSDRWATRNGWGDLLSTSLAHNPLTGELEQRVTMAGIRVGNATVAETPKWEGLAPLCMMIRAKAMFSPMSGDVLWRDSAQTVKVGEFALAPMPIFGLQVGSVLPDAGLPVTYSPVGDTVDVILRTPDRGTFVFEGVPISWVDSGELCTSRGSDPTYPATSHEPQ